MNEKLFQLMLSNGLLIYIEINIFTGDIKKINFDRYFIGKTVSENICDGKSLDLALDLNSYWTFLYHSSYNHKTAYPHLI